VLSGQQTRVLSAVSELSKESRRLETRITHRLDSIQNDFVDAIENVRRMTRDSNDKLAILKQVSAKLQQLQSEQDRVSMSLKVLESLRYSSMALRQSDVKDEYAETFKWIFFRGYSTQTYQRYGFVEWLESEGGIFWVAGKPGSGKSTLMKYLYNHMHTLQALRMWAGATRLVTANHFFWNAGNNFMQMSQVGLLRSLLYQILQQCPDLILDICGTKMSLEQALTDTNWSLRELLEAFRRLAHQTSLPVKMCFFIDGLDEFDGNHAEIVLLFQEFAELDHIKICLSSRPWNVFDEAFGKDEHRKLMLQDLTQEDIQIFVNGKLGKDYRFRALAAEDARYLDLIDQIVKKAQGVFLWVELVVQSLLNGLTDDNDIPDMQRRVDLIPSDLQMYFKHILDSIDKVYQSQTAQIFQMCHYTASPLSVVVLTFIEKERANPDYAIIAEAQSLTNEEIILVRRKMKKYLNARCKGLLEINIDPEEKSSLRYKIDFLHRTVRDFLRSNELQQMLQSQAPEGFDANVSLCRATLAQVKLLQQEELSSTSAKSGALTRLTRELMVYAKEIELIHGRSEFKILDELDRFHAQHAKSAMPFIRTHRELGDWEEVVSESLGGVFLAWAIDAKLHLYVARKLEHNPNLMHHYTDRPLLDIALRYRMYNEAIYPDSRLVQLLLQYGADPNQKTGYGARSTVWALFLGALENSQDLVTQEWQEEVSRVVQLLIEAGADTHVEHWARTEVSAFSILYKVLPKSQCDSILHTQKNTSSWAWAPRIWVKRPWE
jgi:hypothetical protein